MCLTRILDNNKFTDDYVSYSIMISLLSCAQLLIFVTLLQENKQLCNTGDHTCIVIELCLINLIRKAQHISSEGVQYLGMIVS